MPVHDPPVPGIERSLVLSPVEGTSLDHNFKTLDLCPNVFIFYIYLKENEYRPTRTATKS